MHPHLAYQDTKALDGAILCCLVVAGVIFSRKRYFFTFYFEVNLGLQKSCKNYTENSHIPFIQLSLMLASSGTITKTRKLTLAQDP